MGNYNNQQKGNTVSQRRNDSNQIADMIKLLAVIVFIIGVIVSFLGAQNYNPEYYQSSHQFSLSLFFSTLSTYIVNCGIMYAIAEGLQLLEDIKRVIKLLF